MSTLIKTVTEELRRRILKGSLPAGSRIKEIEFSAELNVSRTPLRLALGELERLGYVEKSGRQGFRVREINMDEVAEALELRGVLEGYAARRIAETAISDKDSAWLRMLVDKGRELICAWTRETRQLFVESWADNNKQFHDALITLARNTHLAESMQTVSRTVFARASNLGSIGDYPEIELEFFTRAQEDHEAIFEAIIQREGTRAEALCREHARRSIENKKKLSRLSDCR
ncbi:GntR family transcriptional regulator [Advenella kashmirensis]|uniref:GntR family transcriptional regulator n=1 Tax=Advenella kashmirensis TaxID=310575 RepID=UPI000319462F|nr:GntR family transcriptional regulator [Advenella kashmirensis]